ncbi:MAG: hypothetical protein IGS48_08325 [Oscillatoriales cyanobacterium C42_A2020_001]|nr:hypothetical protein [Leptolyngbyaceae cyanobacterium C42_A2020_001]
MSEEQPPTPDPTPPNSEESDLPFDSASDAAPLAAHESATSPETSLESSDTVAEETAQEISAPVDEAETAIAQPTPSPESALPPAPMAQSQTLQKLQQLWQEAQPRLKAGTIRFLKATIQVLETTVARLEQEPATAEEIATSPSPSSPSALSNWVNNLGSLLQQGWQRFCAWWSPILPTIRDRLPASVNEALSDQALTGAIAGILVLVLWTTSSLFSSQPPKQVAIVPPSQSAPAKPTPEKKTPKPKNLPEVKVIPPPKPSPKPTPSPSPSPSSTSPTPIPSLSPTPKPAPSPTPPPPPLKLTPEQKLIARIQDEVADVSNQSVAGLIQSVQANFRASRLTVKVGDRWYGLEPAQQDKLANDILKRTQQLNFVKLELTDPAGELLARSPVIGSEMIILKRAGKAPEIAV